MPRSFLFFPLAVAVAACSSSSSSDSSGVHVGTPTYDAADVDAPDVAEDSGSSGADSGGAAEASADDASGGQDVTSVPPPDPCAHITCSGAYQACCVSTGSCYDTRCSTCCY